MLKVTIKFTVYCAVLTLFGCDEPKNEGPDLPRLRHTDSLSEARIDSAYTAIRSNCDSLIRIKAKAMADSLLKDSTYLLHYFDTIKPFNDADEKVERVVRQLRSDCDSSLLRETYRIARLQKRSKPAPRTKVKALPAARRS